jgi:hypothetical protein
MERNLSFHTILFLHVPIWVVMTLLQIPEEARELDMFRTAFFSVNSFIHKLIIWKIRIHVIMSLWCDGHFYTSLLSVHISSLPCSCWSLTCNYMNVMIV